MKKLLISTNLLSLGFIIFLVCTSSKQDGTNDFKEPAVFESCASCGEISSKGSGINKIRLDNNIRDYLVSELPTITPEKEFVEGVSRYRNTIWQASNASMTGATNKASSTNPPQVNQPFKDARSCWYSLDTIKKFICLMENYSSKIPEGGSKESKANLKLGIRFYYATYSTNPEAVWNSDYAGCHTIFMVPTYNSGKFDIDFDPRESFDAGRFVRLTELLTNKNKQEVLFMMGGSSANATMIRMPALGGSSASIPTGNKTIQSKDAPKNQGGLCPPYNLDTPYDDGNSTMQAIDTLHLNNP